MSRSRAASIALAAVLLAGCGSSSTDEPTAPPSQMSEPSETASPSPTATPIQPPANLPEPVTGQPVWTAPGKLVAAFPDLVVTVTSDDPAVLAGTASDGTQRWSSVLQPPASLDGRPRVEVLRLRDRLAVIWTGDSTASPNPSTDLTLLDPATGQEAGRPSGVPEDSLFIGQKSLDSFAVRLGTDAKKVVTLSADDKLSVSNVDDGPSIAKLPNEDRIGSAPAKGPVNTTGELVITEVLSVRQFETLTGEKKRWYQLVDTAKSKPIAPASPCADADQNVSGVNVERLSPSATVVGIGQAVVHLDSGKVTCLATLSQDAATSPTVVGDDGAAFGEARGTSASEGTFYAGTSGEGSVATDGKTLPAALLQHVVIFAGADQNGVVAYNR